MAHDPSLEFYKIVRTTPELWQDLAAAPDTETLVAKVTTLSGAHGITLSPDDIRAALADLPKLISETADDEELSDEELELVAAGAQTCGEKGLEFG